MAAPTAPKSIAKREPAAFATALVTLVSTALFLAPSVGVPIPDTVQKAVAIGLMVAGGFGIRSVVTPVLK
jgi:hypothetical protein